MDDATDPPATARSAVAPSHADPAALPRAGSPRDEPADPAGRGPAWLHVVSGGDPHHTARGVFELTARFLARGDRVLLMDGVPGLALHGRFGRRPGPGWSEALDRSVPLLDLVQPSGRLGLYLLAHGGPRGAAGWPQLGRVLDAVRPHFGRAILALSPADAAAFPDVAGRGRPAGWWACPAGPTGGLPQPVTCPSIRFRDLGLERILEPTLEALDRRLWGLVAARRPIVGPAAGRAGPPRPLELDCDLRVRERLRFLLWMRRVAAEGRRAAPARG